MIGGTVMNSHYDRLTEENRAMVDTFVEFLFTRQVRNNAESLEAYGEILRGETVGPFESVDELMDSLNAED